jgi:hypothetical protein
MEPTGSQLIVPKAIEKGVTEEGVEILEVAQGGGRLVALY